MEAQQLPDDAVVIRGGINETAHVQEQAREEFQVNGVYSLSVCAEAGWTVDQIAVAARFDNRQIRKSTAGRLRAIGCEVSLPTGRRHHADLILPQPPTDSDWVALESAFDPPEPNPYRSRNRG